MEPAAATFSSAWKFVFASQTRATFIYIVLFTVCGIIIITTSSAAFNGERFSFKCVGEPSFEQDCLEQYNKGPNQLQANMIFPAIHFTIPFLVIILSNVLIGTARDHFVGVQMPGKLHIYPIYISRLVVRFIFYSAAISAFIFLHEKVLLSSTFRCHMPNANKTIICKDTKATVKSSLNCGQFAIDWLFLCITFGDLLKLLCTNWRNLDEEGASAVQGCKECQHFAKQFFVQFFENIPPTTEQQRLVESDNENYGTVAAEDAVEEGRRSGDLQSNPPSTSAETDEDPQDEAASGVTIIDGDPSNGNADEAPSHRNVSQGQLEGDDTPDSRPVQEERSSSAADNENIGQDVSLLTMNEDYNFINNQLAMLLDPPHPSGNWEQLAYKFGLNRTEVIKIKYGGTAHRDFFVILALEKPNITLMDLKQVFEGKIEGTSNLKVFSDIEKLSNKPNFDKKLSELLDDGKSFLFIQEHIADKLVNVGGRALSWENVASYYGFKTEQIKSIQLGGKSDPVSPTCLLIESLAGSRTDFMVATLIRYLEDMNRNEVARAVKLWLR